MVVLVIVVVEVVVVLQLQVSGVAPSSVSDCHPTK